MATSRRHPIADRITVEILNTLVERRGISSDVVNHVSQDIVNAPYSAGPSGALIKPIYVWFDVDIEDPQDVELVRRQCLHTMNFNRVVLPSRMVFMCYLNYMNTFDTHLRRALYTTLAWDFKVVSGSYTGAMQGFNIPGFDYTNISDYDGFMGCHHLFAYGILGNLIGKFLDTNNFQPWKDRRKYTYAVAAGVLPDDDLLDFCFPSQPSCLAIYQTASRRVGYTRQTFKSIRACAQSEANEASPVSVATLTMLAGAGISNFIFIDKWIICLNPILLGWQELSKYVPFIIAAYKKYNEMGNNAPYCRLLFDGKYLTEFHRERLKVPFTVARAIAQQYGSSSIVNLQGGSKEQEIQNIVKAALTIIKVDGGARTRTTEAVRQLLINDFDNKALLRVLNKGADMTDIIDEGEDTVSSEIIPLPR